MGYIVIKVAPVIEPSVRRLCVRPYHAHPKGCPNFGEKKTCPPMAPLFNEHFDMTQPIYAVINIFDFKGHVEKMREKHPDWSQRRLECVLYWQNTARKQLKEHVIDFLKQHKGYTATGCPEAMGINVTATLKNTGFELEWPPKNKACQVALVGVRRRKNGS